MLPEIELTKDAKVWGKLWSTWAYWLLMAVTFLEGASQVVSLVLPVWQGIFTKEQYAIFVAVMASIQHIAKFIKQKNLTSKNHEQRTDDQTATR